MRADDSAVREQRGELYSTSYGCVKTNDQIPEVRQ